MRKYIKSIHFEVVGAYARHKTSEVISLPDSRCILSGNGKRLPLSRRRRSRYVRFRRVRHFLPRHPLDASRDRNRHARIPSSMRTYVGVFTNVISVIMGHPVSVQQCAGRPTASLLEMISVVLPCFSLDFAVTKADVTWDYVGTPIKNRWLKDALKFATATVVPGRQRARRDTIAGNFGSPLDGRWKWNRELIRIDF